jgi:hypothetical protein
MLMRPIHPIQMNYRVGSMHRQRKSPVIELQLPASVRWFCLMITVTVFSVVAHKIYEPIALFQASPFWMQRASRFASLLLHPNDRGLLRCTRSRLRDSQCLFQVVASSPQKTVSRASFRRMECAWARQQLHRPGQPGHTLPPHRRNVCPARLPFLLFRLLNRALRCGLFSMLRENLLSMSMELQSFRW